MWYAIINESLLRKRSIVDVIFSVDCFLYNLSEKKISKRETDLLNIIVVDAIFKQC